MATLSQMIEYLKQITDRLDLAAQAQLVGGGQQITPAGATPPAEPISLFVGFSEELARYDTLDFDPSVRAAFVEQRSFIKHLAIQPQGLTAKSCADQAKKILPLLQHYGGIGSGVSQRDFSFINNPDVRKIVERDYKELRLRTYPDGAWKSTVVLSGSILEAILYDQLIQNPTAAMGAPRAPKITKNGPPRDILLHNSKNRWTLENMIEVASDLQIISKSNENSIDEVLREYRNFVHPRVEVAKGIAISEGHAMESLGSLEVIIDHLS